jgi:hypothetical protein
LLHCGKPITAVVLQGLQPPKKKTALVWYVCVGIFSKTALVRRVWSLQKEKTALVFTGLESTEASPFMEERMSHNEFKDAPL